MDKPINERWIQFAYLNAKGNVKTAFKFPFHTDLVVDQYFQITILGGPLGARPASWKRSKLFHKEIPQGGALDAVKPERLLLLFTPEE
jgi:hypothetical protein